MSESQARRREAHEIWQAGLEAVAPERLVRRALRRRGQFLEAGERSIDLENLRRVIVVGCGKAGAPMAEAVEGVFGARWSKRLELAGCVNVLERSVRPLSFIDLHAARSAAANEPSAAGVDGSRRIESLLESSGKDDLLIVLISGGGSALLPAPAEGMTLSDKLAATRLLHQAGAPIEDVNCVRKHLSTLKGGGLLRRFRGRRVISLILSDVIGNPLDAIASGPSVPDPTTYDDALSILDGLGLRRRFPKRALRVLEEGARGERPETLKRMPRGVTTIVCGDADVALAAAGRRARALGYRVLDLGPRVAGETKDVATALAGILASLLERGRPIQTPACILVGGETTVTLGERFGTGGRNQEFALAAFAALPEELRRRALVLSGGTDGEDGPTDAAGGYVDSRVLRRGGLDALRKALADHDAYPWLEKARGLIKSGFTETNVMDLRVLLAF